VVIQNNLFNSSKIRTVVVCAITSNTRLASSPGNVSLRKGTAGLDRRSVVNVTQLFTVDREDLVAKIGTLSPARVSEILEGVRLVTEPREID
jgi:mRNA interferase MazF